MTATSCPEPLSTQQPTRMSDATQSAPTDNGSLAKSGDALGSMVRAMSTTSEQQSQPPHETVSSSGQNPTDKDERPLPTSAGFLTALSDPVYYHVKHPLQSHWTLHQKIGQVEGASSRGVSQDDWERSLKKSVTIGTVEDFWCVYNSMQDFSTIPNNCDYFFMREGVKPMWEDPANKGGCELRIVVTRNMDAVNMWKMALLATVGSQFSAFEVVTGVQFAFRSTKNRISVWLAAASPEVRERLRTEFGSIMERASGLEPPSTTTSGGGGGIRVEINEFSKSHDHHGGHHGGGDRGEYRGGSGRGPSGRGDRGDRSSTGNGWSSRGSGASGGPMGGGSGRARDYR